MLYHFAASPGVVADFLHNGRALRRGFREESLTDLLMGSLRVGQSQVISRDEEGRQMNKQKHARLGDGRA